MVANKIHERFSDQDRNRSGKKNKAYTFAAATIPNLYPNNNDFLDINNLSQNFPQYPHSSMPARGVTGLSSKLTSAMLPPTEEPFLDIMMRPADYEAVTPEERQSLTQMSKTLQDQTYFELKTSNLRQVLYLSMQHLQVIGDCLVHQDQDNVFSFYRLDSFTVTRDIQGDPAEIILRRYVRQDIATEQLQSLMKDKDVAPYVVERHQGRFYPLYTHCIRDNDTKDWTVTEYIGNKVIPDTQVNYSALEFPYYVPRWKFDPYDNYGVSLVEQNYGDIIASSAARQTLMDSMAIGTTGFIGLKPGRLRPSQLDDAKPWDVVPVEDKESIIFFQPQLSNQIQAANAFDQRIQSQLRSIFLMGVASELTGQRVTATQIRAAAQQLQNATGGLFSTLARSIMEPIARVTLMNLVRKGRFGEEVKELVASKGIVIHIKTGIDAMGRDSKYRNVVGTIVQMSQAIPGFVNMVDIPAMRDWVSKVKGIPSQILKTDDQLQQEQQQQLLQTAGQSLAEEAGKAGTKVLTEGIAQNG